MSVRGESVPLRLAAGLLAMAPDRRDPAVAAAWAALDGISDRAL